MKTLHLIFLAFLFTSASASAQTTMTLQVSQDAAIGFHDGANTSGNNYGSAIQNAAFMIPASADPNGYNGNRALIAFNLAAIPAGAILISAQLNLYALGPFGSVQGHFGTANASYLQRITQNWGEYTATWNNQPPSVMQNQVTLSQSSNATQDYLNINVMALVQDMLNNPSSSFGFLLKLVNEVSYNGMAFASKDYSNVSKHPTLVITYRSCNENLPLLVNALPSTHICNGTSAYLQVGGASSYTWLANQQVIGQSANVVISPTANTVYTVNATDNNGCQGSAQITVFVTDCTGIEKEKTDASSISMYPNPSSGNFNIASESKELFFDKIYMTDTQGRLVKIYEFGEVQTLFEIKDLAVKPGIYFCRVMNGTTTLQMKKIIITD